MASPQDTNMHNLSPHYNDEWEEKSSSDEKFIDDNDIHFNDTQSIPDDCFINDIEKIFDNFSDNFNREEFLNYDQTTQLCYESEHRNLINYLSTGDQNFLENIEIRFDILPGMQPNLGESNFELRTKLYNIMIEFRKLLMNLQKNKDIHGYKNNIIMRKRGLLYSISLFLSL
ncbi:hypothetical protein HZS_6181 [Henneguya salminicola]|nr:hypothetical protein HZS_6181 [Henneguya salminicola]